MKIIIHLPFQTVLADIEREQSQIAKEFKEFSRSKKSQHGNSFNPLRVLHNRLKHQDTRCRQLKECLNQQQEHSKKILQGTTKTFVHAFSPTLSFASFLSFSATREQHKSEIDNLETLIKVNQEILQSQMAKYNEQVQRLVQSDALVRQLVSQNESLIVAIELLEDSIAAQDGSLEGSLGSSSSSSSSSGIGSHSDNMAKDCLNAMCKLLISEEELEEAVKSQATRSEAKEEPKPSLFARTKRMIS